MSRIKIDNLPSLLDDPISRATGGTQLIKNNKITYLRDSTENFPAWLEGIQSAKKFICIEMYIWNSAGIGKIIRDLLIEKLQSGVNVYVTYDWFGSLYAHVRQFFQPLINNGAQVYAFNKLNVVSGLGIMSRNHRKSIIIDGRCAYISGLCFSSAWQGDSRAGILPWRDSGLTLEGPIVLEVLKAFQETWSNFPNAIFNEDPLPLEDFSKSEQLSSARVVATSRFKANMIRLDLLAITFAKSSIWITDAYFMPTKMYLQVLINAAKDGVDVRVLVPRYSDMKWISLISRTQYRSLLEAGVRIFEWNNSMIHAKTLVLDGMWARIGSTNLNISSWFANSELDVVLEGKEAVAPLALAYVDDLQHSTEVILSQEKQAQLVNERTKLTPIERTRFINMQSKAITRQIAYFGKSLDEIFRGRVKNQDVLDKPEFYSFVSISIFFLILTILFVKFTALVAYPIAFLLFLACILTASRALQIFKLINRSKKTRSNKGGRATKI